MSGPTATLSSSRAVIRIVRESAYKDRWRRYSVYLDGAVAGRIGDGQTVDINTEPTEHAITLRIGLVGRFPPLWGSRTIRVSAKPGDVIYLRCSAGDAGGLEGLGRLFQLGHPYIDLWLLSPDPPTKSGDVTVA